MLRRNNAAASSIRKYIEIGKAKKNRRTNPAVFNIEMRNDLDLLDCFEHLECGLVGADKKTLEVFTQTLALQCVATRALFLSSHVDLFSVIANSESLEL
ncbi:MAG: hypothetical protein LH481_07165 [Burkholderiales bacterium]|nr:hypothetical protein [Burkholderiales bacterium]